jgi:hypothetical protein
MLDATETDTFSLRMNNVIPPEAATEEEAPGPYPVMVMDLRRTS